MNATHEENVEDNEGQAGTHRHHKKVKVHQERVESTEAEVGVAQLPVLNLKNKEARQVTDERDDP